MFQGAEELAIIAKDVTNDPICLSGVAVAWCMFPILLPSFRTSALLQVHFKLRLISDTSWGWKMWHKSKLPETPLVLPSRPFVRMGVSSAGVWETRAATAALCDHSWRRCVGSKPHVSGAPSPRWKLMVRSFLGEILAQAGKEWRVPSESGKKLRMAVEMLPKKIQDGLMLAMFRM